VEAEIGHPGIYEFAGFRLEPAEHLLRMVETDEIISVSPRAFDALVYFVERRGQLIDKTAVVAFRGTEPTDLINWLADASNKPVAFHSQLDARVHDGFYRNARAVWPRIVEFLLEKDPERIYFTGHSFGAALAVLSAALLSDYAGADPTKPSSNYAPLWEKLTGVFTFGQPMVGDERFGKMYGERLKRRLHRFVYSQDIVPHLPSVTPGWRPVHFGPEYHNKEPHGWSEAPEVSRPVHDILGSNIGAAWAWLRDQLGIKPGPCARYSWADHAPNNYVRVSLPNGADAGSEFD